MREDHTKKERISEEKSFRWSEFSFFVKPFFHEVGKIRNQNQNKSLLCKLVTSPKNITFSISKYNLFDDKSISKLSFISIWVSYFEGGQIENSQN